MPVSPRDFELYSRMTGAPMPSDPMSRMQMAPAVYNFTKNFAKKPNLLEKTGNLAKTVGKIGLTGLGMGFKQSQANEQRAIQEQLREQSEARQAESRVTGDSEEPKVEREKTPAEIIEDKRMARLERTNELKQQERDDKQKKALELLQAKKQDLVDPPVIEEEVQQPTTADEYDQNRQNNQTAIGLIDRKNEQAAKLATNDTVAETLAESQDSSPSPLSAKYGSELDPADLKQIGSGDVTSRTGEFFDKLKSDPLLALAFSQRGKKEELIDDSSIPIAPLLDNVDSAADGGEDMSNIPGQNNHRSSGVNTGATVNLNQRKQEIEETVRKGLGTLPQAQQDKIVDAMLSPSDKQVNLLEQREIDNEDAIKSGFMNLDDEGRKKESIRLGSNFGIPNKTDMQEIRKSPEFKAAQESMKPKSVTERANDLIARTDFTIGGMKDKKTGLGKSVGVSLTPMNGDTAVTYNIMNDPTKPLDVTRTHFTATPEAVKQIETGTGELGEASIGQQYNKGKRRMAGLGKMDPSRIDDDNFLIT